MDRRCRRIIAANLVVWRQMKLIIVSKMEPFVASTVDFNKQRQVAQRSDGAHVYLMMTSDGDQNADVKLVEMPCSAQIVTLHGGSQRRLAALFRLPNRAGALVRRGASTIECGSRRFDKVDRLSPRSTSINRKGQAHHADGGEPKYYRDRQHAGWRGESRAPFHKGRRRFRPRRVVGVVSTRDLFSAAPSRLAT